MASPSNPPVPPFGESAIECTARYCPLNKVRVGMAVRIKRLQAEPALAGRLREIGFCEEQLVRLLAAQANIICQVCNARLALSTSVAEQILVEPVH